MSFLLFIIIFIEGYVVLASELLAIRLVVPWVGSGTDVISIVIAAVLLPLAFGYHFGGRFQSVRKAKGLGFMSIRKKLLQNIMVSSVILCLGLSYTLLGSFFAALYGMGVEHRLVQAAIYAGLFLVYPVFLLGQTIPLISHYYSSHKLAEMTGKMLFFSTVGSFMGSIFSTVILMSTIGVHNTSIFIVFLLSTLILLLMKRNQLKPLAVAIAVLVVSYHFNSGTELERQGIVNNNGYNTVHVLPYSGDEDAVIMMLNDNASSSYKEGEGSIYNYAHYIEGHFIKPIDTTKDPKKILVLGAAGFTLGIFDTHNEYIFVDIDPDLKEIAEEKFLKQELTPNKKFSVVGARGFLTNAAQKGVTFDLVIQDTFSGGYSVPEHLVTREYFEQVRSVLKPGSVMIMNTLASASFEDIYSQRLDNTVRSVFPRVSRLAVPGVGKAFNAWEATKISRGLYSTNVVYTYHHNPKANEENGIYTDDKNTVFLDK